MNKFTTVPEPKVPWARHKTERKPKQPIPLHAVLTDQSFMRYQNSSEKQRKWVEEFARTGDSDLAARIAYPTAKVASVYQLSVRNRRAFRVSKKDLEETMERLGL